MPTSRVRHAFPHNDVHRVADHSSHGIAEVPLEDDSRSALLVGDLVHMELAKEFSVRPEGLLVEVLDQLAVAMEGGAEYGGCEPMVGGADLDLSPFGHCGA
eukprot:13573826-Heterocapsa_arctica.AAC.1